jgi:hypothetical protein
MEKISSMLAMLVLFAMPALAATKTYKDVPVVDANCSKKVANNPDAHTRACALKCAASGFGIFTKDKQFLKFDSAGNEKIEEALKASQKKDHLRVDVTGDQESDTLKVASIKLL